jgi:hypothetical protein
MTLFWFLVCLQVGIFALAFLSDLIWKRRMVHSVQRLGIACQGCSGGNSPVEVSDFWVHQYRDCWISCDVKNQQKITTDEIKNIDAPLAEADVSSSQIA